MAELELGQMEKRIVKLPPPYATKSQARRIKHHLVDIERSFSDYAMEAVMEKMEREEKAKRQKA